VSDRQIVLVGTLLGAAAGMVSTYLLFTEDGRRLRADLEPELNVFMGEIGRLKGAFDELRQTLMRGPGDSSAWPRRTA
jgi:gas vesicle protein